MKKKLLCGLILLNSLSSFAAVEQSIRLTSENISTVEVTPAVCYVQNAILTITLKNKNKLIFSSEGYKLCDETNLEKRNLANEIASIQNGDIESYRIGENVICVKNVGYVLWDNSNNSAHSFTSKRVTVACPK